MNRREFMKICGLAASGGVLGVGKATMATGPPWEIRADEVRVMLDGSIYADDRYICKSPGEGYMFVANTLRVEQDPNRVRYITNMQ